jgi:hypothetical protein
VGITEWAESGGKSTGLAKIHYSEVLFCNLYLCGLFQPSAIGLWAKPLPLFDALTIL